MSKPNGPRSQEKQDETKRAVISMIVNLSPLYTHPVLDSVYFRVTIVFSRVYMLPFHYLWADDISVVSMYMDSHYNLSKHT